jgi:Zn-dependent protease with chaperone function
MDGRGWAWSAVAGSGVVLASFGVAWLVARLGVAIALLRLRRPEGVDWVELARRAYPARRVIAIDAVLLPIAVGAIVAFRVARDLGLDPRAWGILAGLAGMFGALAVGQGLERRLARMARPSGGLPGGVALGSLLIPSGLLPFALMLALIPARWGWEAAAVLLAGAGLVTFHLCGGWLAPLRWWGLARPASGRISAAIERIAGRVGVRPQSTIELDSPQVNAMAWPVPRFLLFTGPILEVLDDDGLSAIVAHEVGHLDEPWAAYLTRILSSYFSVGFAAALPLAGSYGVMAGLAPIVAMMALVLVARRVGRRMEERSDRLGRAHEGESAGTYARALEAIYRANLFPATLRGRRNIHPDLYDRLIASGVTPDYPRPAPPPRVGPAAYPALLLAIAGAVLFGLGLDEGRREAYDLGRRAETLFLRGEREVAVGLFRRAAELDPETPEHAARLAWALAGVGRLDEAEAALRRAEEAPVRFLEEPRDLAGLLGPIREEIRRLRGARRPE